jgi:hypothetical protein
MDKITGSQEAIDVQAFQTALRKLKILGAQSTDEERSIRSEYGSRVADDMAHGSPTKIGHALIELIGTLPGSNLSPEAKGRGHTARSLVSSYASVDAELDKKGDNGLIEATVNELNTEKPQINIRRGGENTDLEINLYINENAGLTKGSLVIRTPEMQGTVIFGPNGTVDRILQVRGDRLQRELTGKKIPIAKVINQVTGQGNLGQKGDVESIVDNIIEQAD